VVLVAGTLTKYNISLSRNQKKSQRNLLVRRLLSTTLAIAKPERFGHYARRMHDACKL